MEPSITVPAIKLQARERRTRNRSTATQPSTASSPAESDSGHVQARHHTAVHVCTIDHMLATRAQDARPNVHALHCHSDARGSQRGAGPRPRPHKPSRSPLLRSERPSRPENSASTTQQTEPSTHAPHAAPRGTYAPSPSLPLPPPPPADRVASIAPRHLSAADAPRARPRPAPHGA